MDILDRLVLRLTENGVSPDIDVLNDCIESAASAIMSRRYPFSAWPETIENRYKDLQFRIALDLYNKIGAEGELTHGENGVSRRFESSWISEQLLSEVTPKARI